MSKLDELIKEFCPSGVEYQKIGNAVEYEQPTKYIVTSTDYNDCEGTPVLTAGQTFILGYTNEKDGIYAASKEKPVIIFDDFTGAFKWVDFPFKVKSSAMKMLTAKKDVAILRYIYHCMGHLDFSSSEHKRLWIGIYSEFQIPVPPIPVQEEIVRILDSFTELTTELTARKKQYEYYRDFLLTKTNADTEYMTVEELFEFKNGLNKGKEFFGKGTPIINFTDVFKNRYLTKDMLRGRVDVTDEEIARYSARKGDLFFTRTSETKEEIGMSSVLVDDVENCVFSGFVLRARPKTNLLLPKFCSYYFSTNEVRKQIVRTSTFTTRALTSAGKLSKIRVPILPKETQAKIVQVLDNFDSICSDLKIGLPAEIEARTKQYEYYRDKLLSFKETPTYEQKKEISKTE